jgi:hypothetical protein
MITPQEAFTERRWSRLLAAISEGSVLPIVGPELVRVGPDGASEKLDTVLARALAETLDLEPMGRPSLDAVATAHSLRHGDPGDLCHELSSLLARRSCGLPAPLRKLAEIRAFDLFVSTTFDPLLGDAVDAVRFDGGAETNRLAFFSGDYDRPLDDIPRDFPASGAPAVFQLFGRATSSPEYVIADEDVLRFLLLLQSPDRRPTNLFDRLRTRDLLLLGCNLPDWLARFFLACAKGASLFGQSGARGGIVADDLGRGETSFVLFLERRQGIVYRDGDALAFVNELHRRWLDRFGLPAAPSATNLPGEPPPPDAPEGAVFLSYASEDRPAVRALAIALAKAGIEVWFDERKLEAGDEYRKKIERNIERASFFVAVLSKHTTTTERRFFRVEWTKAVEEAKWRASEPPFLVPIVIDDTPVDDPSIPDEFRSERHIARAPGGEPPPDLPTILRERLRALRRREKKTA